MDAVSSPPPPRSTLPPAGPAATKPRRVLRSFSCSDELWRAFEARAAALECSVDWLLAEAMKRLLESVPAPNARPPVRRGDAARRPPPPLPPPRPPPLRLALRVDGARTLIDRDAFVLGRSADANLVLRDPGVSRQHALIERVGAAYVIVDMASTNGVVVNGTRVARAVLHPGDIIRVGPFAVHVERATPSSTGNPA